MIPDAILHETFQRFPRFRKEQLAVEPLEKGGSGRRYYRLSASCAEPLILVTYTGQREENRHFCDIAYFLAGLDLRVPAIYHHDADRGVIWVEDLGAVDLWHYRESDWGERRTLYRSALEQVAALHTRGHRALEAPGRPTFQKAFDSELYRWEQDYFFENCVGRHFGITQEALDIRFGGAGQTRLREVAELLAGEPRVLVHRDFQSQNVMIRPGTNGSRYAALIDFQGMRPGLGQYDLASLLYDPYVPFTEEEREILVADYCELLTSAGGNIPAHFDILYQLCGVQRLMQALGAYGFLGHTQGKPEFLQHIPGALERLHIVAQRVKGLEPLCDLVDTLRNSSLS